MKKTRSLSLAVGAGLIWTGCTWQAQGRGLSANQASNEPVPYVLVVTGSELLEGIYADGHTQFITRTLEPLGGKCLYSISVGDRREELLRALAFARDTAPLVIMTGGLGPTDVDITREILTEFTGIPLRENPSIVSDLERRLGVKPGGLNPNTQRQARVPVEGTFLPNAQGTAVGLVFDRDNHVVVALPGPPDELQPMVTEQLVPYLVGRFGIRSIGTSVQMRFVGIGESALTQTIHDHLAVTPDLIVSFKFESGRVDVTFGLPGHSPADEERLRTFEKQLLEHVAEYFYSDTGLTLEQRVLGLFAERKETLGLAEVGSYGAVAEALAEAGSPNRAEPDSDDGVALSAVKGGFVAHDVAQLLGMLGVVEVPQEGTGREDGAGAKVLAARVRDRLGSGWGLGTSERYRSADGSTSVWVALTHDGSNFATRRIPVRSNIQTSQRRLVTDILDFVRRTISP